MSTDYKPLTESPIVMKENIQPPANYPPANYLPANVNFTAMGIGAGIPGQVAVGPNSCHVICPACRSPVETRVVRNSTTKTHLMACGLLLCCFCICCCFLPYCMNSCRNANHSCPKCGAFIGTYES